MEHSVAAHLAALSIEKSSDGPLYRQIKLAIRGAILSGRFKTGQRLPASRTLAADFRLSRHKVVTAFDQLVADGYSDGRTGAGTYVSSTLPEELLNARMAGNGKSSHKSRRRGPSKRGATCPRAFSPGPPPELVEFPF